MEQKVPISIFAPRPRASGLPDTMKVIEITAFGGPEVLKLAQRPLPTLKPGHVLVKLTYIGMMFGDIIDRAQLFEHPGVNLETLPMITGHEAVGVVVDLVLGPDVPPDIAIGTRVTFDDAFEAYAEYVAGPAERFIRVPDDIPDETAAALIHNGIATHAMIEQFGPIIPGEAVLVTAARGGEGSNLVQWLSSLGAKVIARTRNQANANYIRSLGAWQVIEGSVSLTDEVMRLTDGKGVRLAFDGVGGPGFPDVVNSLGLRGLVVTYGNTGGDHAPVHPLELLARSRAIAGFIHLEFIADRPSLLRHANAAFDAMRAGVIKANLSGVYPLEDMRKVHELWEQDTRTGKVLVKL